MILQPQYITKSVVSFLPTKRVKGGFARCFLCRMDLQTTSGGFRSLHEQWKSTEQQLREIEYPLQHGKLPLNGNCKKTSRKERERQKAPVVGLTLVHLESTLSVAQVLDTEDELDWTGRKRPSAPGDTTASWQTSVMPVCRLVGWPVWVCRLHLGIEMLAFCWVSQQCHTNPSVWTIHNVNHLVNKLQLLLHVFGQCTLNNWRQILFSEKVVSCNN